MGLAHQRLVSPCHCFHILAEVSIWSAEVLCDHLFAWVSKTHSSREGDCGASVVRANLVSRVILIFRVNQATQLLFSTEFSYWAILILLLFISLINTWIGRLSRLSFEYPGSAGAGPQQATRLEKVSSHFNPKKRQCQRMFKLLHDCTQLIY